MGKYPFNDYSSELIEKMRISYSPETVANRARRYRRMGELVKNLKDQKQISTMSPKQFTEKDVYTFLVADRSMRNAADMVHEVNALRKLMLFVDNPALELCLNHNPELKPRLKGNRRKGSMSDESYNTILEHALKVDPSDFKMLRAYALVLLCLDTGTRNKEIRFADVNDIDLNSWTLDIVHVKGESTYGEPRIVPIREEVRPVVTAYLKARAKWVAENGCTSRALFPSNSKNSDDGFLCGNSLRRIKDQVVADSKVQFDLRECRRTFGQRYLNDDLEVTSVSVLMGHSSTRTTERFYGRQKNLMAMEKARSTWQSSAAENKNGISPTTQESPKMVDNGLQNPSKRVDNGSAHGSENVPEVVTDVPTTGQEPVVDNAPKMVDNPPNNGGQTNF